MKINVFRTAISLEDAADEGLAGIYQVTFDTDTSEVPQTTLASIALLQFHEKFGLSTLEDFEISVVTDDHQFIEIEEADVHSTHPHNIRCALEKIEDVALDLFDDDADLSAEELDDKYNPNGDGEHPRITRKMWREAVSVEATISGYWDWLEHTLLSLVDEESKDVVKAVTVS